MPLTVKKGDTQPFEIVLKENGSAVDLTTATSVRLYTRRRGAASNKVDGAACTVTAAATGQVEYEPGAPDVNESGVFDAYFLVAWADGTFARFPTAGYETVTISPNLE